MKQAGGYGSVIRDLNRICVIGDFSQEGDWIVYRNHSSLTIRFKVSGQGNGKYQYHISVYDYSVPEYPESKEYSEVSDMSPVKFIPSWFAKHNILAFVGGGLK